MPTGGITPLSGVSILKLDFLEVSLKIFFDIFGIYAKMVYTKRN